MTLQWSKRLATAILGMASIFGMLAPAQAVIITTDYDPSFGAGPLYGYGWRARINFEVPADCFNQAGIKSNFSLLGVVLGCNANPLVPIADQIEVLSAQAGIYANGSPGVLLDVLTFNPSSLPLFLVHVTPPDDLDYVVSWSLVDGNNHSNAVRGHETFDDDIRFRLLLNGPTALLQYNCDIDSANCSGWTTATPPRDTSFTNQGSKTFAEVYAQNELRVGALPEPGSVALVLVALGAGLAATRRR